MKRSARVAAGLFVLGITACIEALHPLPLDISLDASRTAPAVGDTVNFLVTTQGGNLLGINMDYGDNSGDQFGLAGARTAKVTFRHVFAAAGSYQVQATVTDATTTEKSATVQIQAH